MNEFYERISKLSPSRLALLALDLQTKLTAAERARNEPIAIVGMSCRFPGAESPEAFWELLRDGVDAIGEIPRSRWDKDAYYDPDAEAAGKIATRWGGFIEPIDRFEPQLFGISPREALSMDPQQRLLLEVTWEALERAGQSPQRLNGSATGVFVGMCNGDYGQMLLGGDTGQIDAYLSTGNAHSVASGRLSYVLGLQGPSLTVDTACSSSLVAIHLAVQSLRAGECRMALAGGVNVILSPLTTITLSRARMMASDGRCKAFDARADGFVRSEGCGMIVLKRLSDARADGDPVLALLRGSALNQDGRSNGLTAPNGPSQITVIRAALADAGLAANDVHYVETHGTGTSLGDPIEAQALGAAYGERRAEHLQIGSVKTNIGHLESAAGVAGLIKLVLMIQHGAIPPHLHLTMPSPHIAWDELPIEVPTTLTPWPERDGRRIAAVSSFGFSGTNAHMILESPPSAAPLEENERTGRALHLLTLSARTRTALRALAGRYARHLAAHPQLSPGDVAYTANYGRAALPHRLALVGASLDELQAGLAAAAAGIESEGVESEGLVRGHAEGPNAPAVAFLFTGHGAQYIDMGRLLYETEPIFRRSLDRCAALLREHLDRPLLEILFAQPEASQNGAGALQPSALDRMDYAQPALFALQIALTDLWRSWGIEPAAVAGHSVGEYAAAVVAGVMSLEEGIRLVAARGRLMASLPSDGEMAAVFADEARVEQVLAAHGGVSIAAINGPENIVISGGAAAVRAALADLETMGIKTRVLAIPLAAHSPQIEPILDPFARVAATIRFAPPQIDVVSGMTGALVEGRELADPDYWRRHLRRPVRFADAAQTLYRQGYRLFVEIGPHPTLLGMMRRFLPQGQAVWAPSLRRQHADDQQVLLSLGALVTAGAAVDWGAFYQDEQRRKVLLPTYPFERERYWIDGAPQVRIAARLPAAGGGSLLGAPLRSPALQATVFETRLGASWPAFLDHHRIHGVALLPSPVYLEMALEAARHQFRGDAVAIEQFEIREALILPESGEQVVQFVLTAQGSDGASFEVFSRSEEDHEWTLHATGRLARAAAPIAAGAPFEPGEIQARCAQRVDANDYYARLFTMGLEFGESFRGLSQIWRREGEALGLVELAPALKGDADRYDVHPALLDACFHLLGAPLPESGESSYLLIAIDRFRLFGPLGARLWNHTVLRPGYESSGESFTGDIRLYDEAGRLVAEATGLHLKVASRSALLQATRRHTNDWLYDVQWQQTSLIARTSEAAAALSLPEPDAIVAQMRPIFDQLAQEHYLAQSRELIPDLETLSAAYAANALGQLGWSPRPGERVATEELADRLGVIERHRRLFGRMLGMLAEEGMLRPSGAEWEVVASLAAQDDLAARAAALQARAPDGGHEVALTVRCGERLADVLRGRCDPLNLLFPNGSLEWTEPLYRDSTAARVYNATMRSMLEAALARLPVGRPLRVLEIGAGSGATSASLLSVLPREGVEYWFTDLSTLFLARAQERFAAYPFLRTAIFDVERPPREQGIPDDFDLVVAANVLHATARLRQTLAHVRQTLAPGGLLMLLEGTRPLRWVDLTFGLTEGWWRFTDSELRPAHPLLRAEQWRALLATSGFETTAILPGDSSIPGSPDAEDADQVILLAGAGADPNAQPDASFSLHAGEQWLILADAGGVGAALADTLRAGGADVALAYPGVAFAELGAGRFQIAPGDPDDLRRLFAGLGLSSRPLRTLYLWGLDAPAGDERSAEELLAAQETVCGGALRLTQALAGQNARLWLVTRNAQTVLPNDAPPAVAQATLWGLGRVIALEQPELWGGLVDLPAAGASDSGTPHADAMRLLAVLGAQEGEDQAAVRNGALYAPRLVRARPLAVHAPTLRADGSYLVTGGLGGLGLKIARWLAECGARHLVLTGRRGLPERTAWSSLPAGSREAQQAEALQAIEALGVAVHVVQADVVDRASMERLFARFDADLPPLRGLIHAAADLSNGTIRDLSLDALRAQLRPKLGGGWLLHELTRERAIDFFVLFSSTTALWGSRSLAHYAAANQALDTLAHYRRAQGLPALTVNWGTWDEMRVASTAEREQVAGHGLLQMPAQQAFEILGGLIEEGRAVQKVVASVDWRVLKPVYEARGARPFFARVGVDEPAAPAPKASEQTPLLLQELAGAASSERPAIVTTFVRNAVARALGAAAGHAIDDRQGLFEMGMDSLMSIELKGRLEAAVGQPLPSTLTFNYPSVEALAGYLLNEVLAQVQSPSVDEPPDSSSATPGGPVSELTATDDLSEDDLAALIAAKLARL